jgi:hypothetical protein
MLGAAKTGYAHPGYAASLREFGEPLLLRRSGGWLLKCAIPGSGLHDAIAPYPYLICDDWSALAADLEELGDALVCISAVPDPFGSFTPMDLASAFPDTLIQFKDHFVADLELPFDSIVSSGYRASIRRAARKLHVEHMRNPRDGLETWNAIFPEAIQRFGIRGIRAFSPLSFAQQLALPGADLYLVRREADVVAAAITMQHGEVVHAHVMAMSEEGRRAGAAYLLYSIVLERLAGRGVARWVDWGGVAGTSGAASGLSEFKKGWSTKTVPCWFGGRILDRQSYSRLVASIGGEGYFPAYRVAERS